MKNQNSIEDLFEKAFINDAVTPPIDVKENIDKALFLKSNDALFFMIPAILLLFLSVLIFNSRDIDYNRENSSKHTDHSKLISLKTSADKKAIYSNEKFEKRSQENSVNRSFNSQHEEKENDAFQSKKNSNEVAEKLGLNKDVEISDGAAYNFNYLNETGGNQSSESFSSNINSLKIDELKTFNTNGFQLHNFEKKKKNKTFKLNEISVYTGVSAGVSKLNESIVQDMPFTLKAVESIGFDYSLESFFPISSRIGITSGVDLNNRTERFEEKIIKTDSSFLNQSIEFIYNDPVTQDSIIDSILVDNYSYTNNENIEFSKIKSTAVSIPFYLTFRKYMFNNVEFRINSGIKFSYLKQQFVVENEVVNNPILTTYGIQFSFKPEFIYNFNRIGVGVYGKSDFDIVQGVKWNSIERNRIAFGTGVFIRARF